MENNLFGITDFPYAIRNNIQRNNDGVLLGTGDAHLFRHDCYTIPV